MTRPHARAFCFQLATTLKQTISRRKKLLFKNGCLLSCHLAAKTGLQRPPPSAQKLLAIELEGNKLFDAPTLRERMGMQVAGMLQPHGRYSHAILTNDLNAIKNLYRANGYESVQVTSEVLDDYEGERGDICAVGQTVAAQELCRSVRPYRKTHHVQTGVGHYGVFSGRKWNEQIYPRIRDMIYSTA